MSTLDASLLLAHFNSNDSHHANATDFLAAHVDDDHFINPLNLAEVLVGPARAGTLEQVRQAVTALGVVEQPFPVDAATELADLRARTTLKMPDCCVLLTARQTDTPVASFDDRLRRDARGLGLTVVP